MKTIFIHQANLDEVMEVLNAIPEFDHLPTKEAIQQRILHVPHLVLTAHDGASTLGCKIGYLRDGYFYSWLGAVKPEYRQIGVATLLADEQEKWASSNGYDRIRMKTRNRFPEMLLMAIRRGFKIAGLDIRDEILENRILLEKEL